MKHASRIVHGLVIALLAAAAMVPGSDTSAQAAEGTQTVLGPGLYTFQTRTRTASCADDERTGYVWTFMASIHGVPGSRSMRMDLTNSPYWPSWTITVNAAGEVIGDAFLAGSTGSSRPASHFSVTRQGDRFTGEGTRSYDATVGGTVRHCVVTYDALLRRIDA